jgi:hypothetical protein
MLVTVGIVTCFVIGWQSWDTRRAAENSGKQLSFQKEVLRPRLKMTEFTNNVFSEAMAGEWAIVNMKISNHEGLPAYPI